MTNKKVYSKLIFDEVYVLKIDQNLLNCDIRGKNLKKIKLISE